MESAEHSRNIMRAKRVSPRTANPESRQAPRRAGELANQWKDTVAVVEAESYIEHAGHKHISLFDRLDWKISSLLLCSLRHSGNSIQVALVLFISSAA